MSAAELKTYAEITEIAFRITALIVGAAWAVYAFFVFRQRETAVTALKKAESEAASLELAARRRAVLDIAVNSQAHPDSASHGYILAIQIVITNAGVAAAYMKFDEAKPSIRVHRVDFDERGVTTFSDSPIFLSVRNASDPTKPARSRVIRAGGTSRLSTVLRIPEPGVYAVSFRVPMDAANTVAMREAGADPTKVAYWSATSFACVGLSPSAPRALTREDN